jgi:S1-C subfamily serine protease
MGYRQGRPPVVRLGRVLFQHSDVFITDCLNTGGDSGGPFFDLDGRLVGIIGHGAVPAGHFSGLVGNIGIGPTADRTTLLIQQYVDAMLRSKIAPDDGKASDKFLAGYLWVEDDEILPREYWTQGAAIARAFQAVIRGTRPGAVSILDELGRDVVLGTVV